MICKYCKYKWKPQVEKPKACPKCKRRLDYEYRRGGEEKK